MTMAAEPSVKLPITPSPDQMNDLQNRISSTSPPKPGPEQALTEILQKAEKKRFAKRAAEIEKARAQLAAWGEDKPIDEATDSPFIDPLGHLSFSEQKSYLANPPASYFESLEERARQREEYDRELFHADPLNYWHLCYSTKPDFSADILPVWKDYIPEHRLKVMEKYRRYDKRLQQRIQEIWEVYDSEAFHAKQKKVILTRSQREIKRKRITAAKRRKKEKILSSSLSTTSESVEDIEEPPLAVAEVRAHRQAVKLRNQRLIKLWHSHIRELREFEDISKDGVLELKPSVKRFEELGGQVVGQKEMEEKQNDLVFKEWEKLPGESRTQKIDWVSINNEL